MFWYIIWGPTSYGAPVTGPQSRKMPILAKYKMAASDQIVHMIKKMKKTKKFIFNEFVEKYLNFRGLRSNLWLLLPKNRF